MILLRSLLIGALIGVSAARRIQVAVNDVAFSLDATSEDQLHDFCVLQGMRVADCRQMRREWAGRQERATHQQTAVTIYVVPMNAKVHNFAPVFERGSDGGYTLANSGAPDWLLSVLSMLPAVAVPEDTLSNNISVHVVAPWRSAPEAPATGQAWRPPVPPDHGGQNTRVVVLLLGGISHAVSLGTKSRHALERAVSVGSTGFCQLRRAHEVEHKGLDPVASTPRNQQPSVPPAHHLPMRVLAQMRHRRLGETAGHGHFNLHLEPTLASWHPRMARPRALAQASVERPRDEAPPAAS